mmetsp:Transcript_372/g.699  ORF Transcript_372/g.699 Transcript_372/m.699 type:complete len:251 (-) Transcript_372:1384-2136(-)
MEAVDLGVGVLWQAPDVVQVSFVLGVLGREVDSRRGELVVVVREGLVVVEGFEDDGHQPSVLVLSHSAAVVALSGEVVEGVEGHLLGVLVNENQELSGADSEVGLVELVLDVPAEGAEEPSLLDEGVEEAEAEEHLPEDPGLGARLEPLLVGDGVSAEGLHQVRLQAHGGLVGHLDAVLQDRDGEHGRGVGGQPQAEVAVGLLLGQVLTDLLQVAEPGDCEVAVLEDNPVAQLDSLLDHLLCLGTLALSE